MLFGITGGIGSGKTVVADLLQKRDVAIIEADAVAKELTYRLPEIRYDLTQEFGPEIYADDGMVNLAILSELVFSNPESRQRVNTIIHPHVFQHITRESRRLSDEEGKSFVGVEAALIYESKMHEMLDRVVVVNAPLAKRTAWIRARNNLSPEEIQARIDAQMPIEEKIERADYVIENDGSLQDLPAKVDDLYNWLLTLNE